MKSEGPNIEMMAVSALRPYSGNARRHSREQIRQIAESMRRFGFTNPVLISDHGEVIARHGRVLAAKELGLETVPTLRLSHLSAEERLMPLPTTSSRSTRDGIMRSWRLSSVL